MKKIFTLFASIALVTSAMAQAVADSAVTGASYANDVFYSLPNSTVSTAPIGNWHLGFEITGNSSSIIVNTQNNVALAYQSPYSVADWANVDTAGISAWQRLDNAPENWSAGALNSNTGAGGGFDLGWGIYDLNGTNGPQHAVNGDSIFVLKIGNSWKKLRIDRLYSSEYSFTWADLDGQNEQKDTLAKSNYTGKNFGYYNLTTATELNREPATADWDLLFTRYVTFDYSFAIGTPQSVTGVLLNKNVKAVKVTGVDVNDVDFNNYIDSFTTARNTIGHNWKAVNTSPPPTWLIEDSTTFFVRRPVNGEIWKVVFTGFGGSGNGKYFFNKELVLSAPSASVTSVNLEVCAGDTVLLTANAGNGYTYQWYKGATLVSGAIAATLKVTQAGNYSVKVTDRGAFSQSTAVNVIVNALPTATATSVNPLCAGNTNGSITVNATGGTGSYTYTWTGSNSATNQAQNLGAGSYSVVVTDSLGCEAASVSATLTAPAALVATAASLNNTATASATGGTSPYTYAWSDAGNQTTATATGLANGGYTVTVTDNNGCSATGTVTISVSSINEAESKLLLQVYPNPAKEQLNVIYNSNETSNVVIQLSDVSGRMILRVTEMQTAAFSKNISLNDLQSGIYILNVQSGKHSVNKRIVVE